jgi:hypothetical protein
MSCGKKKKKMRKSKRKRAEQTQKKKKKKRKRKTNQERLRGVCDEKETVITASSGPRELGTFRRHSAPKRLFTPDREYS